MVHADFVSAIPVCTFIDNYSAHDSNILFLAVLRFTLPAWAYHYDYTLYCDSYVGMIGYEGFDRD